MAAATMYVTPEGAGDFSGSTWANAMGYTQWETDVAATAEAGDIYYVAGGTYTLTSDFETLLDGTAAAPILVIGVNSGTTNEPPTTSDYATGTNRPLITDGASAYAFEFDDFWIIRNIRMTGSDTYCIRADISSIIENCKAENDGVATRAGIQDGGVNARIINCESVSTNGNAIQTVSASTGNTRVISCYVHDSVTGILSGGSFDEILFNIIDTMSTAGITLSATRDFINISYNTIYSTVIGINGSDNEVCEITNNILSNLTTGVTFTANSLTNWANYNDYYSCTTDRSNIMTGANDVDIDPGFVDAPNGNFAITGAI